MKRRLDWPERLASAIAEAQTLAFSEAFPCVVFAADVVRAMTDEDPLPERDETVAAAYARMRREGYETLREALAAKVGPEVPLAFARRGDVILRRTDGDAEAVGICLGQASAFISADGGIAWLPTLEQEAAFRVGDP